MNRPIRIFWSPLTNRFYASQRYKTDRSVAVITGEKFDVTDDIAAAIKKYDLVFSEKRED